MIHHHPRSRRAPLWCLLICLAVSIQCRSPIEPEIPELLVQCPSGIVVENAPVVPATVGWADPTVTGGVAPVSVTCSPSAGSAFPVGTRDVVCHAADSAPSPNRASCIFSVTVSQTLVINATKFMAFGDSITAGELGFDLTSWRPRAIDPTTAYPTVLRQLLQQDYPTQEFIVENEGESGEPAACAPLSAFCGAARIAGELADHEPQVLLLLQGANDLYANPDESTIPTLVAALRSMVRDAKFRNVSHIFLSTLLPQREGGSRARAIEFIEPANEAIRDLAFEEDVFLVDAYAAFIGREATLIGPDGLHPTPAGFAELALAFQGAIKAELETIVTTPAGPQRLLGAPPRNPRGLAIEPRGW